MNDAAQHIIVAFSSKIVIRLGDDSLACKRSTISNIVDNFVTAIWLVNETVFANADLINTSIQQAGNNIRDTPESE